MSDMREKLAKLLAFPFPPSSGWHETTHQQQADNWWQTVLDEVPDNDDYDGALSKTDWLNKADRFIELIPGMIPELEWEDGKHGYVSYNSIGYRIDTLISSGGESQLCYFGYEVAISLAKNANAVLKKKASEHHRQQLMKALGL